MGKADIKADLMALSESVRMYTEPVLVIDQAYLALQLHKIRADKKAAVAKAGVTVEVLQSNPKFAEALKNLGVEVPTKISPRTGKEAFALAKNDADFLDLLEHPSASVVDLVKARLAVKSTITETRCQTLLGAGQRKGTFPVNLKFAGAHTQRFSGGDTNPQNLTPLLKKALRAGDNQMLANTDASQIEARILAWLSTDDVTDPYLGAFLRDEDVYKNTAGHLYKKEPSEVTPQERHRGKIVTLASGFGLSPDGLLKTFKVAGIDATRDDAVRAIEGYRRSYFAVPKLWGDADRTLRAINFNMNYPSEKTVQTAEFGVRPEAIRLEGPKLKLPNGTSLYFPELRQDSRGRFTYLMRKKHVNIFGAKLVENVVQALAAKLLCHWISIISQHPDFRIALTVHDSILVSLPRGMEDEAKSFLQETMQTAPPWATGLPLKSETTLGSSYGEMA